MKFKRFRNVHIQYPAAMLFSSCEAVSTNLKSTQVKLFIANSLQKITELGIAIDEKQSEPTDKISVSHERLSLVHPEIGFGDNGRIHHVGSFRAGGKTMAVICSNQGVFVEFDGTLHALLTQLHEPPFDAHTLYGPSAMFQARTLCVGSSTGEVLFYQARQNQLLVTQPPPTLQQQQQTTTTNQQPQPFSGVPTGQITSTTTTTTSSMSIMTTNVSTDALNFDYCGSVKLLASGITAMTADSKALALADKTGKILILNSTSNAAEAASTEPQLLSVEFQCCRLSGNTTDPAATTPTTSPLEITCMRLLQSSAAHDYLIVGTMSGSIHYYERTSGKLRYEIDAHAKAVSDLSVRHSILLSASEDGFVRVWMLDDSIDRVIHTQSIKIDDAYPTGVTFLNDRMFCVISYDDPTVQFYEACVG